MASPNSDLAHPNTFTPPFPIVFKIASLPGVKDTCFEEKRTWLGNEPEKIISATIEPNSVYEIATMQEAKGYDLYNSDLDPVQPGEKT
jgi:hypothetical protein